MKLMIHKLVDGKAVRLGDLDIADSGEAALTVTAAGAEGEALRSAWEEVRRLRKVPMKWSERDPGDPSGGTERLMGREVSPGDADYPRAVADYLSRRYGFFASPAEYG